jgi:alpha-methylacyl-CoA racemase
MFFGMRAFGMHGEQRGTNLLDSGAHFYDSYETADGKHVTVGALEPQFYAQLLRGLGLDAESLPAQLERSSWPAMKQRLAEVFKTKTRDEWGDVFANSDACCGPVLSLAEVTTHPHNRARGTFVEVAGMVQPAPAPRFSRTRPETPTPPTRAAAEVEDALAHWGVSGERIRALRASGVLL